MVNFKNNSIHMKQFSTADASIKGAILFEWKSRIEPVTAYVSVLKL